MSQVVITIVITAVIVASLSWSLMVGRREKDYESKIDGTEAKSREIIEEALKTIKTKKCKAILETKGEALRTKNELERETKRRCAELQHYENRMFSKEGNPDKGQTLLEKREQTLQQKEESTAARSHEVDSLYDRGMEELERIAGLLVEQTKEFLLRLVEDNVKRDKARLICDLEDSAKEEADRKAEEYVVSAIQRCAVDSVVESAISVIQLPGDGVKGRITGHESRNIRTLEQLTGVELTVDDTPEAIVLSGFDPMHREITKVVLEKLISDGRIYPTRTEEMVKKAQCEVDTRIREAGEAAVPEVDVRSIRLELIKLLRRIRYRMSYRQDALRRSIEAVELFGILAAGVGIDMRIMKHTGLLRDIGRAVDYEIEGSHVQLGMELYRRYKENQIVISMVESHHGDVEPESLIACIVRAANTISAARLGARHETIKTYTNRLTQLEEITSSFEGVGKSFVVQAGRGACIVVVSEKVTDDDMVILTHDIAKRIEREVQYPGQIRVNVIRESRIQDVAK